MWLEPLSQMVFAVALLGQAAAPSPPPVANPIVTRLSVFTIPFRVDKIENPSQQPVEVQLYVSTDRGSRWQLYAKAQPTQQHFVFRAGTDGEYWFAIRTIDRSGQARPETINGPGLRVSVDTISPVVKLSAFRDQTGQVAVQWEIDEPNIKPGSFSIRYRSSNGESWQPVSIERQSSNASNVWRSGEVTFWPKPGTGDVQIQLEAADMAGNPAVVQANVKLVQDTRPAQTAALDAPPAPTTETKGSVAIAINPAIGKNMVVADKEPVLHEATPSLPSDEKPRMVNSREFQLEYDIDSVGPSGIGRVELWGTRDGGKTWRSFAIDDDNRSPVLVNVTEEGVYGFLVSVTNGAGLGGKPPKSGDLPDLCVGVDWTKPTARISSAQQGVDAEASQMIISWQADDKTLATRPVSLLFSANRTGPWLPIASGLENTGRYAWSIDKRTPPQVYLRLEVRDEAGNVGIHETTESTAIDQSQPTIRIRDVRPVGPTSARVRAVVK